MRALIFELRPEALTEEGIVAALGKQAAALSARSGLPIAVDGPRDRLDLEPKACRGARGRAVGERGERDRNDGESHRRRAAFRRD